MSAKPTSGQTPTRRSESSSTPVNGATYTPLFAVYARLYTAANREWAIDYGRMARNFHDLHAELIEDGLPRTHEASIALEEIAVELEDIAESMALAGSKRFADLVEREIAAYIPARKLDAQT